MSKKADSVTSEIRHLYEDTVRESLPRVFRLTFGTPCRQPDAGFRRIFNKRETSRNLWWSKKPQDTQVEMDFLAHVAPLNTLPDINTNIDNSYVKVFKSTSQTTTTIAGEVLAMQLQQTKSESPEKTNTEAKADGDDDGDDDGDGDGENFQYVIAEITCGGAETVLKKLEQLEKDCYFLCSRACPSLSDADFQVLATVAFVAVVSPKLKENLLRNRILSTPEPLPLLRELYNCGRFVWIEHTQTLGVVVKEIGNRLDSVVAKVSEQNEATQAMKFQLSEQSQDLESKLSEQSQALESKLSEQSQALESKLSEQSQALESKLSEQSQAVEAKLSEQSQTIKALSEQLALFQQKVLERLPER